MTDSTIYDLKKKQDEKAHQIRRDNGYNRKEEMRELKKSIAVSP